MNYIDHFKIKLIRNWIIIDVGFTIKIHVEQRIVKINNKTFS